MRTQFDFFFFFFQKEHRIQVINIERNLFDENC